MSHLGDNHLLCVAGEHCRGKLDAKEKAAFSFKYLLVYSFRVKSVKDALYPSGQPTWQQLLLEPGLLIRTRGRTGEFPVGEINRPQAATDVVAK